MAEDVAVVGQPKGVSVIGYSIVAGIADDRQITFQHFVSQDVTDEEANRDLDRIMSLIDRQKAIYELPKLVEELQALTDQLSQGEEDLKTVSTNHDKAVANLELQVQSLENEQKSVADRAYQQHAGSGRRGEFVLKGNSKNQSDRLADEIAKLKDEIKRADIEADVHRQSFLASQQRRRDRVAIVEEKIAERRELAPGGG